MFINTLVAIQNSTLLVVYVNENVVVYIHSFPKHIERAAL